MAVHFMQGDARKLLLGDDCLHLTLGSPPYLKARKYDRDDIARDVAPWVEFMLDATRDRPFALDMRQRIHLLREAVAAAADQDFDESVRGAYRLMIGFTTGASIRWSRASTRTTTPSCATHWTRCFRRSSGSTTTWSR